MDEDQLLKIDPVWGLYQYPSYAAFHESIGDLFLRPEVPAAIRRQLGIVHKLLQHSYFEYGFLDVALARAVQIFEMAIKTRYTEVEGKPPKRSAKLKDLIDWTGSRGLLEQPLEISQIFREIRNSVTHGSPDTILGFTALQMVQSVVDFVNELYENTDERECRHATDKRIGQMLSEVVRSGAIVAINGKRLIVFHAQVVCSIAIPDKILTYVAYFPIFDAREVDGSMQTPQAIFGRCADCKMVDESLLLFNGEDSVVVVSHIEDEVNRARYLAFKNEYNKHEVLTMSIHSQVSDYCNYVRRDAVRACA